MGRRDELEARAGQDGDRGGAASPASLCDPLSDPLPEPLRQALAQGLGVCQLAGEGLDWRAELGRTAPPAAKLLWVRSGVLGLRLGRRPLSLRPGQALLLDPSLPLHLHCDDPFQHLMALLPDEDGQLRREARASESPRPLPAALGDFLGSWSRGAAAMPWQAQWHAAQAVKGWWQGARALPQTPAERLRAEARALLAQDPAPWDAAGLARRLRVSRRHLDAALAQEGLTATQLIWAERLNRARAALLSPRPPSITTLAFELGFKDSAHFSRKFRQQHGAAPRQWQALQLQTQDHG